MVLHTFGSSLGVFINIVDPSFIYPWKLKSSNLDKYSLSYESIYGIGPKLEHNLNVLSFSNNFMYQMSSDSNILWKPLILKESSTNLMKASSLFLDREVIKNICEAKVFKLSRNTKSHSFALKKFVHFPFLSLTDKNQYCNTFLGMKFHFTIPLDSPKDEQTQNLSRPLKTPREQCSKNPKDRARRGTITKLIKP